MTVDMAVGGWSGDDGGGNGLTVWCTGGSSGLIVWWQPRWPWTGGVVIVARQ